MKYYDNNISDIYKELKSSANGISNWEADNLLIEYGKNELPKAKKQGIIGLFFSQFLIHITSVNCSDTNAKSSSIWFWWYSYQLWFFGEILFCAN